MLWFFQWVWLNYWFLSLFSHLVFLREFGWMFQLYVDDWFVSSLVKWLVPHPVVTHVSTVCWGLFSNRVWLIYWFPTLPLITMEYDVTFMFSFRGEFGWTIALSPCLSSFYLPVFVYLVWLQSMWAPRAIPAGVVQPPALQAWVLWVHHTDWQSWAGLFSVFCLW